MPYAHIAQASATDSQEFLSQTSEPPSLNTCLLTVTPHPTDSNRFICPKLWSLSPQPSGTPTVCLDSSSLNRVGTLSPRRELGNDRDYFMRLPSLRGWNFTLHIGHCLTSFISLFASFISSSFSAVNKGKTNLLSVVSYTIIIRSRVPP